MERYEEKMKMKELIGDDEEEDEGDKKKKKGSDEEDFDGEAGEEEEDPEGLPGGAGRHHPPLDGRGHVVPHLQDRGHFKMLCLSTCRSTGEPPLT